MSVDAMTVTAPGSSAAETEVSSPTRRRLIAAGAALGAAGLLLGNSPIGPTPGQADLVRSLRGLLYLSPIVANFAFEMEELQKDFFTRVTYSDVYRTLDAREQNVFSLIASEDCQHFDAIANYREESGNKDGGFFETPNASHSRAPKRFSYPAGSFSDRDSLYKTSLHIKETSLFAYHGAVDLVNRETLMLAAAIAGVEGRHVALLRLLDGMDPVPSPFESSLGAQKAGQELSRYGFTGGGHDGVITD